MGSFRSTPFGGSLPLRIGIDGRAFLGNRTGIGRYVFELCRCLDYLLPDSHFFVYCIEPIEMPDFSGRWHLKTEGSFIWKKIRPIPWLKFRAGRLCRQDHLQVFWGCAVFLPRLPSGVRTVVTVHDLNFKVAPKTMGKDRWLHHCFLSRDIWKANSVLANSHGTSQRLKELVGREADAIVQPAVGKAFKPQSEERIRQCKMKYQISFPYLLAVATWEPRKNLGMLVRSFMALKNRGLLPRHCLVLVGGRGWKDERLAALISEGAKQAIVPLGFVPDDDLPALYAGADVFIFPSIYEGFGMPVLEARACGTRVVATNIPELREAGGLESIYVEPTLEGISEGILKASHPGSGNSFPTSTHPTWEHGGRLLAEALIGKGHG